MNDWAIRHKERGIARTLDALVEADGSAGHAYVQRASEASSRDAMLALPDMADAAYHLCLLHGRHPGVIDHAATRSADNAARAWLIQSADGFAQERAYLTQVTVALGPVPSTAGQADCEATISQQRHALDMLAQSDRRGCAIGAAISLTLDWHAVRRMLDIAAIRIGVEPLPCALPDRAATLHVVDALGGDEGIERAIQFGARQLLAQHRGLWDLLSARAQVRAASA